MATAETLKEAAAVLAGIDGAPESLGVVEEQAKAVLARSRADLTAHARRHAVLTGLATLGYQVTEVMETAWVRNGRVVLKKASQPGYGIEIGGGADAARLQVRSVAFRSASATVDPGRDRDAETMWCGDLARLRLQFAADGGEIVIERALAVGATPLRVVADTMEEADSLTRTDQPAAAARERRMRDEG